MKKIFISRSLKPTSPIRNSIGENQLTAKNLIDFSALEFDEPQADWIFFYSRNGVKYFFENGNYELYPYLWACMSEGTADELAQYITDVSFVGNGSPGDVAQAFKDIIKEEQVACFVRAENSLDSVKQKLARSQDFSVPVYSNIPNGDVPKEDFDILVFTSPMNVGAWFAQRTYKNEKIISIGKTTAKRLTEYNILDIVIADTPSEASLAKSIILAL